MLQQGDGPSEGSGNVQISRMVIWYDILVQINWVSKVLQSKDMQLDVTLDQIQVCNAHSVICHDSGFDQAMDTAKCLAL